MIVIALMLIGAVIGVLQARRRQGTRLDMFQYAAAHAIFFTIIGILLTIVIDKLD